MGFHVCTYCPPEAQGKYGNRSSGDVTLVFGNGNAYEVPDMILHYIEDHKFLPPSTFMNDVLNGVLVFGGRLQTKGAIIARIGYLEGEFETGQTPAGFVSKLEQLMKIAARAGGRIQCREADRKRTRRR